MAYHVSPAVVQLRTAKIWVRPGRRELELDPAHAANLAVSFQEIGQRHPIGVRPLNDAKRAETGCSHELVEGLHRLEAAILCEWQVVDAIPRQEDDIRAAIAEADENLISRSLSGLQRAQAIASRLQAWAAAHPEMVTLDETGDARAKRGRPKGRNLRQFLDGRSMPATMGFREETATAAGISVDTVERALAIFRGMPRGLQDRLATSAVAKNDSLLRQLAALGDKDEQAKVAELLIAGKAKNVPEGQALAAGRQPLKPVQTPVDEAVKAFRKLWAAASPSAREAILQDLAGRSLPKGWSVSEAADV